MLAVPDLKLTYGQNNFKICLMYDNNSIEYNMILNIINESDEYLIMFSPVLSFDVE